MVISELIKELEDMKAAHGDLPVAIFNIEEVLYDTLFYVQTQELTMPPGEVHEHEYFLERQHLEADQAEEAVDHNVLVLANWNKR